MRLTKGMYGSHAFQRLCAAEALFGLYYGQMRDGKDKLTHNSGWYNKLGEKLGYGDLSVIDMQRICNELEDGELFIVLAEGDSFWTFVGKVGMIGATSEVDSAEQTPGIAYVADKARYVLAKGKAYHLHEFREGSLEYEGMTFEKLTPQALLEMCA